MTNSSVKSKLWVWAIALMSFGAVFALALNIPNPWINLPLVGGIIILTGIAVLFWYFVETQRSDLADFMNENHRPRFPEVYENKEGDEPLDVF